MKGKHHEGNLARKEESFFAIATMSVAKIPVAWVRKGISIGPCYLYELMRPRYLISRNGLRSPKET